MSPLGSLLQSWLHPYVLAASLVVAWWAVWFTLGREFRQTLYMCVAARAVSTLGAYGLLASGALGTGAAQDGASAGAWLSACMAVTLGGWAVEAAILGRIMKRLRTSWRWNRYDLAVLGAAHLVYVLGAALLHP